MKRPLIALLASAPLALSAQMSTDTPNYYIRTDTTARLYWVEQINPPPSNSYTTIEPALAELIQLEGKQGQTEVEVRILDQNLQDVGTTNLCVQTSDTLIRPKLPAENCAP